jgi:glucan phosphoethanolaminetransferase (alkaline phosphatase superfamily)
LKKAGYNVWWISNQSGGNLDQYIISKLIDKNHIISFNNSKYFNCSSYDDIVMNSIKKALADKSPSVIFIHLMGNHYDYVL